MLYTGHPPLWDKGHVSKHFTVFHSAGGPSFPYMETWCPDGLGCHGYEREKCKKHYAKFHADTSFPYPLDKDCQRIAQRYERLLPEASASGKNGIN